MRFLNRRLKRRCNSLRAERLGVDTLEQRIVLDGAVGPELAADVLTIGTDLPTPTATAQFGDFTYSASNSAVKITGYTGSGGEVEIPSEIDSLPVTEIGARAFWDSRSLTSLTITSSVTIIGEGAFYNCGLLTNVVIPAQVTSIGAGAFQACAGLKSITIPVGVTSIEPWTFADCTGLMEIIIPNSVTSIGSNAIGGCRNLRSVVVPASVSSIGDWAFGGGVSLTSITLTEGLTSIGVGAFSRCDGLTSLFIPGSVTRLSPGALASCSGLLGFEVASSNPTYRSNGGVVFSKDGSTLMAYPGGKGGPYGIPDTVTSIAPSAFGGCVGLNSITIPDSITKIEDWTFYRCLNLQEVTIPGSVRSIGANAFSNCSSLLVATIGSSVASVGDYAFAGCSSLTSAVFDGDAPATGTNVFADAPATIYFHSNTSGWSSTFGGRPTVAIDRLPRAPVSLVGTTGNRRVVLAWTAPAASEGAPVLDYVIEYSSDAGQTWGTFDDGTSTETSATVIGLTNGTSYLFRVAAVNDVGQGEFSEPSEAVAPTATATYENFTYSVSNGEVTITDCPTTAAGAVVIPVEIEGLPVTSIGSFAFYRCSSLTSITIPDGVTSIGLAAFQYCASLTSITIPNSVASIGESAFYGCTSLTSVTIPDSVTSIENQAFRDCTSLTSITIGRGDNSIRNDTFHYCLSLISVTIPDSVTSIGHRGFYNCTSLTSIAIPNGITSIGYEAFFQCSNLTSVTFDGTPPTLGTSVFSGTSATIYYYAGAPGWGVTYGGRPTVALTVQRVPGIPAGLVAVPGNTQASLSWSAPSSDGGSPITDYVIQYSSDGGDSWATFGDSVSAKTNVTVTGLTNNFGYVFRVAAVNDAGQGELSAPSEAVTPVLPDAFFSVPGGANITLPNWAGENRIVKQGLGTLILDTANTHMGGIVVEEGTIIIRDAEALGAGALQVKPGAKVVLDAGDEVIRAAGLGIDATANLELGLNRLVVAAGGWNATEIRDRIIGGRNGGLWDGTGISSGMVTGISNRAIGYITNASGDLEISWAALGDANLDYKVDAFDLVSVASGNAYLQAADANWQIGDFNYDNRSDAFDLIQMLSTLLYNQGSYLPVQPAPKPALQADAMMVFAALAMEDADDE